MLMRQFTLEKAKDGATLLLTARKNYIPLLLGWGLESHTFLTRKESQEERITTSPQPKGEEQWRQELLSVTANSFSILSNVKGEKTNGLQES